MKLIVNGVETEVPEGLTVKELLSYMKVEMPDMVSVELNETILERKTFENTFLKEGDRVEFLYFMGGGNERGGT